ncbi:MAG: hypothetical protein A3B13_03520 [Candidatus Liptonbacteria bacterium RIFCSPLOWO2_01_FULL_45_15]|uniref:MazF family transcriptional regulator n=1 Tax=Candidatus Liptonbacteria bacterium RIFCSPLOWO2_01_FULL_45_15 TaxID=1798649 RepID=A0A1G2CLF7_9BACT|nr:MAG: hypothetical protein A3B13_03520 [Candidatus Liptonbacteria bacterium RIFCSPLOWO2_01_FULL_45_15]
MFERGTIVLIPFPFTDLSGTKVRPALIVSQRLYGEDVIVVFISSIKPKKNKATDVPVKSSRINGLKVDSIIKCAKIATLDKKMILGEIGILEKAVMAKVDLALKKVLGL